MSVVYSTYQDDGTGPVEDGAPTTATITANEVNQSAKIGSPMVFTFDVPAGMWAYASVQVTLNTGGSQYSPAQAIVTAVLDMTGTEAKGGDIVGGTYGSIYFASGYLDPQELIPSTPYIGDVVNLHTGTVDGYSVLTELVSGTTATATITLDPAYNPAQKSLTNGNAVMTLLSITPNTPYCSLSLPQSPVAGGPPYAGTATATIPETYPPSLLNSQASRVPVANGYAQIAYQWQFPAVQATAVTGVPSAVSETWSFDTPPNVYSVPVQIKLTNALFPHQISKPLSAVYSGVVYYIIPPPAALITPVAGYALGEDAHGRPTLLTPNAAQPASVTSAPSGVQSTSINSLVSNTAGRTYLINPLSDTASGYGADNFGADNPCLLIDRRSNHFRAIYSLSQTYTYGGAGQSRKPDLILLASGLLSDRCAAQNVILPNISGGLCAAAQHPTDADYALLVYSDLGSAASPGSHDLKAAFSADAGATWQPLPKAILPALDLTQTGRPALCWAGDKALLVYSVGTTLHSLTSADRGQTWTAAGTVSNYGPGGGLSYFCLSMAAHGGQVYLLAFVGDTQKNIPGGRVPAQTSPRLFVSGDLGGTWTLRAAEKPRTSSAPAEYASLPPGVLPAMTAPSGLGVSPASGLLRLDTQHVSSDGGLTWVAP